MNMKQILIRKIIPFAEQPREHFDREKIKELANSIKEQGLIQPLVVRPKGKEFQIIAGERRRRALELVKTQKTTTAIIRDVDDLTAKELSLIENWQREDLTSVERENMCMEVWLDHKKVNSDVTKTYVAKRLGVDSRRFAENLEAKEFRSKIPAAGVSTRAIIDTDGLPDVERQEIIEKVERGDLAPQRVREEVKLRKLEKTLPPVEVPQIKKTPQDFIDELQTRLMDTWILIGVKFPDDKRDAMLKWIAKHFTEEQKKELRQTIQITSLALERFMDYLK